MDDLPTLLRPLIDQPETAPQPVEWIAGQAQRRTRRRRGLTAATAVLVLAVPTWLVVRDEPTVDTTTGPSTSGPSTSGPSTSGPSTSGPSTDPFGAAAPWAGSPLPGSAAPTYVDAAASDPEAAALCPVLAPADLGDGARATPHMMAPGTLGSWGVQYDLPGAPGEPDDGALPTPDAGRTTFSVGATVMPPAPPDMAASTGIGSVRDLVVKRPQVHTWADGSVAGWGGDLPGMPEPDTTMTLEDGTVIEIPELFPDEDVDRPEAAVVQLQIGGADPSCLYTVHSYLGEAHVFHLIEHLRRVEGT
jgi:hypothetical protein